MGTIKAAETAQERVEQEQREFKEAHKKKTDGFLAEYLLPTPDAYRKLVETVMKIDLIQAKQAAEIHELKPRKF